MFEDVIEIVPSNRNILSIISSIYDLVGFLQSLTMKLKLSFQDICRSGLAWDSRRGELFYKKWLNVVEIFKSCKNVYLGRCYFVYDKNHPIEFVYLHGSSDAPTLAHGACTYIKSVSKAGNIEISLVTSKSRSVPFKKKFSMPSLELLGNFILAKLINAAYNAFLEEIFIRSYYCWSDSMISLVSIVGQHKEFNLFVENRLFVIRNLIIPIEIWHYVNTKENIVDFITF